MFELHQNGIKISIILVSLILNTGSVYGQIFWTTGTGLNIARAELDGTGVNEMFMNLTGSNAGIDVNNTHIFWPRTLTSINNIARANLDGTGVDPDFITGGNIPTGIAVNSTHIFWTNQFGNTIGRANLDGTGVDQSFITGANAPWAIAVDGSHIFWNNNSGNTIGRANLDGTGVDQSFITGANSPRGVAVNGSHIFWSNAGSNTIGRANLDGTDADQSWLALTIDQITDIEINDTHIFWTKSSFTPGNSSLGRAGLDGTGVNETFISGLAATAIGVTLIPTTLLPVELTRFDAVVRGRVVELSWETATETDNAGFFVEMRQPGSSGAWAQIGFVDGAGTTTEVRSYTYRIQDQKPGRHLYRLKQVDFDGAFEYSREIEINVELPGAYVLFDAYPNPFNTETTLTLSVARDQHVNIAVFDALGRHVKTLHEGLLGAGAVHRFLFDGSGLPSRMYVFRVIGEAFVESRLVFLVK